MTATQDPSSVIQALDQACNAHDLDTALLLFTDDAEVRHSPPPDGVGVYRGKEQIRRWFEPQMPGLHIESYGHEVDGDSVRWAARLTDDLLQQMGQTEPIEARNEATIRDGKIVSFIVTNPSLMGNA